jgi:hypothetical protein
MAGELTQAAGPLGSALADYALTGDIQVFGMYEDFAAGTNTSGQIGTHGWVFNTGTMAAQASAANHIGITRQSTTGTSGTHSSLVMGAGSAQAIIPMGASGGNMDH